MRAAILLQLFLPRWIGGTEVATYNLAKNLTRRGHEIHIITTHDDGLPYFSEEDGLYVHRVSWPKVRIIGYLSFWARIYLQIRKIHPDVVHCQALDVCIPARIAKKTMNIPYVVWGQGSEIYFPERFLQLTSKHILQNADAVFALTDNMKRKMQTVCDKEISVVPNGIDSGRFEISSRDWKEGNGRTVIFVGRLHPIKGVHYLLEAMAIVHREIPDAKLIIVGDGTERSKLEKLVEKLDLEDCVQFAGQVPQEEIPRVMHQADVFTLPSLSEGLPVVLLEAMAAGLPIVATNVGGVPEILEDGVNGYLVDAKRSNEIATGILMLMMNDEMREKVSANNRVKAKMFTWDTVAGKVEEEYQMAIARNMGGGGANQKGGIGKGKW
ncbi:glycosyltransferase family 4 protein [Methanoculleus sp. Wushi-C6]|uniref:Glycosyltransferase family 4 protein n=1 Tax=Methanoculleus caldifontis TaxID=2651577 RepID=A0ABU3X258_9EURY|nr:GT4 family glycosyltransferase PelF [Methanoculleus sp. Wushi-C6]MDV2482138.1 glycosyltransferase family 4 protein [Methanoculleus sp. Wushi-C6]